MNLIPVNWKAAVEFIRRNHRHHLPPQGWKFGIGVENDGQLVGVITIGRPVARMLDDGSTLEVTRCCTDGTKNAASMLYGAAWRAVKALGYKRLITYTLESEEGTSLVAAGYLKIYKTDGGSWTCPSRPRENKSPICAKYLWEVKSDD